MRYRFSRPVMTFGVCLATLSMACPAPAARAASETGQQLEISLSCPRALHVGTDKGLSGIVRGNWPDTTAITRQPDGTIRLSLPACAQTGGQTPEPLEIQTPPDMPLAIEAPQATGVALDDRTGTVFLHTGTGPTRLGSVQMLDLIADAAGQITIPVLADSARIRATGSATITIDRADGTALSVYLGGSASFIAHAGRLKALEITSASTGDALFHGTTEVAALHTESSGSIIVDKAVGTLATERDGPGRILVNQPQEQPQNQPTSTAPATNPPAHPSGEAADTHPSAHSGVHSDGQSALSSLPPSGQN